MLPFPYVRINCWGGTPNYVMNAATSFAFHRSLISFRFVCIYRMGGKQVDIEKGHNFYISNANITKIIFTCTFLNWNMDA